MRWMLTAPERGHDMLQVDEFLGAARAADLQGHEAVGLGMDVTIMGPRVVGGALTWSGGVPHLSLFPREDDVQESQGIAPPTQRRRARRYFHNDAS